MRVSKGQIEMFLNNNPDAGEIMEDNTVVFHQDVEIPEYDHSMSPDARLAYIPAGRHEFSVAPFDSGPQSINIHILPFLQDRKGRY